MQEILYGLRPKSADLTCQFGIVGRLYDDAQIYRPNNFY